MRSKDEIRMAVKFREDEAEDAKQHKRLVDRCPHCYRASRGRSWALDLVHNFPDGRPRAICHMCATVIHPAHWADGGPNQSVLVDAHPLYPVVIAMEKREAVQGYLEHAHEAAIDDVLLDRHLIGAIEDIFAAARAAIDDEFSAATNQYRWSEVKK